MPANDYQFFTEWRVNAPRELLYEILKEGYVSINNLALPEQSTG